MIEELPKRIHCLGAGGAGMLPLTLYLSASGHQVTAEDDALSDSAKRLLEESGVSLQPFKENDAVGLVYSSAIAPDHPARAFARRTGSLALRRGECLAVIAKEKKVIAVAGSHGKTTTCGYVIDILNTVGFEFDFLLGAQFVDGQTYRASGSEWLVAEVDESDGTIDLFQPEVCILLNVDHDHHALYRTASDYVSVFDRLIRRTRGYVILNAALSSSYEEACQLSAAKTISLGAGGDCEVVSKSAGPGWSGLELKGAFEVGGIQINRVGAANLSNAGFAFVAARVLEAGSLTDQIVEFRRIKRRQVCHYMSPSVQVFEDYAHHPREIDAVLDRLGAKEGWKTVVVFQPHRYSRTLELKAEFAESLAKCDDLVLLPVYAASEAPLAGGTGEDLYEACRETCRHARFVGAEGELFSELEEVASGERTRIIFLGAGIGDRLAAALSDRLSRADGKWGSVYRALATASSFETEIKAEEPLARKTTLRVGGKAERYNEPTSLAELVSVVKACNAASIEVRMIGRGSNLVVMDDGVAGLVIRLTHPAWSRFELLGDGLIRVGAGLRIKALCGQACKEGLQGFEFLEGIPGCVGGVLRMNAGAMGGWVFDVVKSVRYLTKHGEIVEAQKEDLDFGYRYCRELEDAIALDAVLESGKTREDQEAIRRTIDTYQSRRKGTQPREPSAGCIFKNPEGDSAGRLIDELGLKGTVVGGAEISGTHGNFIINRGDASSADVIELVKLARGVARRQRGVELHPEALLFGSSWQEVLK